MVPGHLLQVSRCGVQDYFGTPIPVGGQYDVGAHEYRNLADFNYDHWVNFLDYAELVAAWGTSLGQPGFSDIYDLFDDSGQRRFAIKNYPQNRPPSTTGQRLNFSKIFEYF